MRGLIKKLRMSKIARSFHSTWYATCKALMPKARLLPETEVKIKKLLLYLDGCVYCGDEPTTTDHFFPVIGKDGLPTGFCDDEWNVVPACSTCNSSKGNTHWHVFLARTSGKTPRARKVSDIKERTKMLSEFERIGGRFIQKWMKKGFKTELKNLRKSIKDAFNKHSVATEALRARIHEPKRTRSMQPDQFSRPCIKPPTAEPAAQSALPRRRLRSWKPGSQLRPLRIVSN